MKKKIQALGSLTLLSVTLFAINFYSSAPKGIKAVKNFIKEKYLGSWYEIARLDFVFEKNLNNTTAEYSENKDGSLTVINRGYNFIKNKYVASTGRVKFMVGTNEGKLKVSFFGPFYSGYNIIALDSDYKYALVAGQSLKCLWLLSRQKIMPPNIKEAYLEKAKSLGYDVSKLIWVQHD